MTMKNEEYVAGDVQLRIGDHLLKLHAQVPAGEVHLDEMLPLFRGLTNALVSVGEAEEAEPVSCSKGCGACCRQLVPITLPEAVDLAAAVDALPEPRQSEIRARFAAVVARLMESGWYARWNSLLDTPEAAPGIYLELGLEYFHLGTPCPFLEDEACSIHPQRPLICRQFLAVSAPIHCSDPKPGTVRTVALPARMNHMLGRMAVTAGYGAAFIPLIFALGLAHTHPQRGGRRSGMAWAEQIFKTLSGKELPHATPASPLMTG